MPTDPLFLSQQSLVDKKKRIALTQILNTLYLEGSHSIAKIARELHTSVPSATSLLNELVDNHWVEVKGAAKTKSGRRPVYYDLNASKKEILVLDISVVQTHFVFTNLKNEITTRTTFECDLEAPTYRDEILREIDSLISLRNLPWAIALSAPGLMDINTGYNYSHESLNKDGVALSQIISEKYGIPVFNLNDTRASLLGEHHYGLAKSKKNVLLVNVDWGVGMGILHNGLIVKGEQGFAGEIGHIQVNPNGQLCHCGKIGCLETLASASTIVSKAREGLQRGVATSLATVKREIVLDDIIKAAQQGDAFCTDIILEVGGELGKGLAIAVHLFNPEIIIIDGALKDAGEILINSIKQSIHKLCLSPFKENLQIKASPLGEDAKVFGAKSFVFEKMMNFYQN